MTPSVYQNLADAINAGSKIHLQWTAEDARELWMQMLSHQIIEATTAESLAPNNRVDPHDQGPLGLPRHPDVELRMLRAQDDVRAEAAVDEAMHLDPAMRLTAADYAGGVLYPATIAYVAEFHQVFGHPIANVPNIGTPELRALRGRMILEEVLEFCEAAGLRVEVFPRHDMEERKWVHEARVESVVQDIDIVEMADALGDIDYLASGASLVFGFPHCKIMEAIHSSNMSKLGADGKPIYREDGKVMKGPNYFTPRAKIVEALNELLKENHDAALIS